MIGFSKVIAFIALISCVLGQQDGQGKHFANYVNINFDKFMTHVCQLQGPHQPYLCSTTTTTTAPTPSSTAPAATKSTTEGTTSSSSSQSPLQNAFWCYLTNGTHLPLGYTYMQNPCTICRCTQSHDIACAVLQCMNTYCIDDSKPIVRDGECCTQCAYEEKSKSCFINGISFPHGSILKTTTDYLRCWCQAGNVECRKAGASVFSSFDLWGTGSAVYAILGIVFGFICVGMLLCCGCTVLYYYYYQRNQEAIQQVFEQYFNEGGWQPMNDEDVVVDANTEQKQVENEGHEFEGQNPAGDSSNYIPPPYDLYNGSDGNKQN